LVFLGDYVDGWSQSPNVLDFLIRLPERYPNCIFLRGNHDQLLHDWLTARYENIDETLWFQHGGAATVAAYEGVNEATRAKHILFLESLHNYYIDEHNRLFVHAGFTNQKGATHEYFPRLLYWERTLWEMALALDPRLPADDPKYPARLKLYHGIFIGHTPVTRLGYLHPLRCANVWNVDTGAAFHGPLTLLDADTGSFWQSDPLPALYPGEKGRNP
ncbi:MAG TPA: metallophosphoesterase, partial [Flavobacterium sp.]|nr:metallophosphoesterase [Flavobacterium sp.]